MVLVWIIAIRRLSRREASTCEMSLSPQALELDEEELELLDGFDLVASAYDSTCTIGFDSFTCSSSSSRSKGISSSVHVKAPDSNVALLTNSELGEFAANCNASPCY